MLGTKQRQRRRGLPPEQVGWMKAKLGRWTNLQPDLGRLSDEQQYDLLDLVQKASATDNPDADAFNPDQLGKRDRTRLEKLIEKAADAPGVFKKERETLALRAEVQKIAAEAAAVRPAKQAEGAFFAEVGRMQMNEGGPCMSAETAGMLLLITAALLSGEGPGRATFKLDENGQRCLRWRPGCLFGFADGQSAPRLERTLRHLQRNGWLSLSGRGETRWVTFGPRAARVFGLNAGGK
jgi:hypothetical protein